MQDTLFTVNEVASKLKVDPWTVREWLKSGELKGFKVGKNWRIPESELIKFIH